MSAFLFWIFALLMLVFGAAVIINRNPVASALSLVVSFLGLAALFLYLGTQYSATTGASFTILFGSIFVITPSTVPALIVSALLALATVLALARVLLLSSLSPDLAAARGVPVRAVGAAFLMALAVSVALAAVVIGAVLSTALLIGPAATALRVTKGPVRAAYRAAGFVRADG